MEMPYLERVFGNVMATVSEMCRPLPAVNPVNPPNGLESPSARAARAHPPLQKTDRAMCRQMKFPMPASCEKFWHLEEIYRNIEIISQIEKNNHVRAK